MFNGLKLASPVSSGLRLGQPSPLRRLARVALGIAPREISFSRRGFNCDSEDVRHHLEGIAACFVRGYHTALETDLDGIGPLLDREVPELRGFAYEGAGMALALLDVLTGWRQHRLRRLLAGAGAVHAYLVLVGAGWVLGRLPLSPGRLLARLDDPVLRWLALDGYGFHEGFFHTRSAIRGRRIPRKLAGYARRGFDQGLGRSLWFVEGADVRRIAATIGTFPAERRPDLWSGVGLACGYAGGIPRAELQALSASAGSAVARLAQGTAFAAEARVLAGHVPDHTDLACQILCGVPATTVAQGIREARLGLPPDGAVPAFEAWRQRIQERFPNGG